AVRMTEHSDEEPVRVSRIDNDLGNLLTVAQTQMRPRFACIRGLVDAVTHGEIGTLQALAAADVNDVWIRRSHGDRAYRTGRLLIEDRLHRPAVIRRLPDAAVVDANVEHARLGGHARDRFRTSAAKRADVAPAHLAHQAGIELLR